jgi:hypothetical protein
MPRIMFKYSEEQRAAIVQALPPVVQDSDEAIAALELAASNFQHDKNYVAPRTKEEKERFKNIHRLATSLLEALGEDDAEIGQSIGNRWGVAGPAYAYTEKFKTDGMAIREMIANIAEAASWEFETVRTEIMDRRGGRDSHKERLFFDVIAACSAAGMTITKGSGTKTGGPFARVFMAAVRPVLGVKTPALRTLRDIVDKYPEGVRTSAPKKRKRPRPTRTSHAKKNEVRTE